MSEAEHLIHPSCHQCERLACRKTGREGMPRFFCIGKRLVPGADEADEHNFCIYTPWKGVINFQVNQGDMDLWMAAFYTLKKEIDPDFRIEKMKGWLESMRRALKKSARLCPAVVP